MEINCHSVVGLIFALWSGAGWASDSGVLSVERPAVCNWSVASEPFALVGTSVTLSGELLFPEERRPTPAIGLAHGCEGNRDVEPVWGPFLRKAGYATFNVDTSAGAALTRSAPSSLRSRRCSVSRHLRRAASACRASESRREAGGADGFFPRRHRYHARVDNLGQGELAPAGYHSFRAFFPFIHTATRYFRSGIGIGTSAHPYRAADDWTPAKPCADLARVAQGVPVRTSASASIRMPTIRSLKRGTPSSCQMSSTRRTAMPRCWASILRLGEDRRQFDALDFRVVGHCVQHGRDQFFK